jgi:hypothetical protein
MVPGRAEPLLAIAIVLALLLDPRRLERGPTLCLVRRLSGHRCPGCGMSRSWTLAAHLRIASAFRAHPLGPPTFALALLALGRAYARTASPPR